MRYERGCDTKTSDWGRLMPSPVAEDAGSQVAAQVEQMLASEGGDSPRSLYSSHPCGRGDSSRPLASLAFVLNLR